MARREFELIEQLRRRASIRPPVVIGIGDDGAVLRHDRPTTEVVTTDMLMDGVDFLVAEIAPELIGRKCLAVNLSDIAAMGARPTAAFVALSLPRDQGFEFAERLEAGLHALADEFGVTIAGGDTNSWDGPLVVCVTVIGEPIAERPILRSGAQPGDALFVTGACGGSLAGRHLSFTPRLHEARRLVEQADLHALIDISDGLAADLHHLLSASGVGAIIDAAAIPIHPDVTKFADDGRTPLEHALSDGEDFELLFTVAAESAARLTAAWAEPTCITRIGWCTTERECLIMAPDGTRQPLLPLGWQHEL